MFDPRRRGIKHHDRCMVMLNPVVSNIHSSMSLRLFCDNKSAIQISNHPMFLEGIKHIEIHCYFVRDQIKYGMVEPIHVASTNQFANLLTKPWTRDQHNYFLGIHDLFTSQMDSTNAMKEEGPIQLSVCRNTYTFINL